MTAIKWVKDNIAAFGGDPENITIMGQSAGAASVQMQCQSPLTDGLFHKAVMSSGCGLGGMMSGKPETSCGFWKEVMTRCGCKNLAEFRALPVQKLFDVWQSAKKEIKGGSAAAFPVIDGHFSVAGGKARNAMLSCLCYHSHPVQGGTLLHSHFFTNIQISIHPPCAGWDSGSL